MPTRVLLAAMGGIGKLPRAALSIVGERSLFSLRQGVDAIKIMGCAISQVERDVMPERRCHSSTTRPGSVNRRRKPIIVARYKTQL